MPSLGVITLVGKSGKSYKFRAYPLGTIFKKGFAAVYVITRRALRQATGSMRHKPLVFGHGNDLRRPDVDKSVARYAAANCVCVYAERSEQVRMEIAQDLMAASGPGRAG